MKTIELTIHRSPFTIKSYGFNIKQFTSLTGLDA
jgi:hypothetical protein